MHTLDLIYLFFAHLPQICQSKQTFLIHLSLLTGEKGKWLPPISSLLEMEGHATFYWSFVPDSIRGHLNTCAVLCSFGRPWSLHGHCYAGKAPELEKVAQGSSISQCQKKGQPPGEGPPSPPPTARGGAGGMTDTPSFPSQFWEAVILHWITLDCLL